jgi:hypothetical protein
MNKNEQGITSKMPSDEMSSSGSLCCNERMLLTPNVEGCSPSLTAYPPTSKIKHLLEGGKRETSYNNYTSYQLSDHVPSPCLYTTNTTGSIRSLEVASTLGDSVLIPRISYNDDRPPIIVRRKQTHTMEPEQITVQPNWESALSSLSNPVVSIDTVRLFMKGKQTIKTKYLVLKEATTNHTTLENNLRYSYRNLQVVDSNLCFMLCGSVPNYINGQNLTSIHLGEFRVFLEEMSDILQLDLRDARVSRVDLAAGMLMDFSCYQYFPLLTHSQASTRKIIINESLCFQNNSTSLLFYDKSKELFYHNGKAIPQEIGRFLEENNILRYEVQLKKSSAIEPHICARELHDSNTFQRLVENIWKGRYNKIAKNASYFPCKKGKISYNSLKTIQYDLFLQHYGGVERFDELLQSWVRGGEISPRKKSSLKRRFLQSIGSVDDSYGALLLDELNAKIEIAYRNTMELMR